MTGSTVPAGRTKLDDHWRKSGRSLDNSNCVEVRVAGGAVEIRDTKDVAGPVLRFAPYQFAALLQDIARGRFDN